MPYHRIAPFLPTETRYREVSTARGSAFMSVPISLLVNSAASADVFRLVSVAAKRDLAERQQARIHDAYPWN